MQLVLICHCTNLELCEQANIIHATNLGLISRIKTWTEVGAYQK